MARENLRAVALGAQEIGDDEARIIAAAIGIGEGMAIIRVSGRAGRMLAEIDRFRSFEQAARVPR